MRALLIIGVLSLLTACEDPSIGAGVRVTPNGVTVVPRVTGSAGDVTVTVAP